MEPENQLFENENHLPNLHFWVQNVNFQGYNLVLILTIETRMKYKFQQDMPLWRNSPGKHLIKKYSQPPKTCDKLSHEKKQKNLG